MAAQHLTVLSSPEFPQAFEDAINFEIRRVDRILVPTQLGQCAFEDEYCDCRQTATVHHLESELEYCLPHFLAVNRG